MVPLQDEIVNGLESPSFCPLTEKSIIIYSDHSSLTSTGRSAISQFSEH